MKLPSLILTAAAGCAMGVALPPRATAAVTDEDFNALKNQVQQLNSTVQGLQQEHQQDQQTIQQLRDQLGQTQTLATNAVQKAEAAQAQATPGPSARHNFTMAGDAEVQFSKAAGQHGGFALADFAPIFLYRANDNILFEAGFDTSLDSGGNTTFSMSFGQLDYVWNDYVTVVAGDMLLPLGTYNIRSAGWLTKIPDAPLVDDQILPGSGVGAQLRGGIPIGDTGQMLTYSVYGVNGPGAGDSTTGDAFQSTNSPSVGSPNLDLGGNLTSPNEHPDPSGGGRVGWFYPWKPHYDVELGISGQSGEWGYVGNHLWSAAVLDAAVHISPYFEAKGEYANTWYGTDASGTIHPHGWWVQASYKLAGLNLELPVVNDLELVGRYDRLNDGLGTKTDRYTAGLVYYFTDTLWFESDYEYLSSHGPNAMPPNEVIAQISYGF
ncbi:MAG: hypothetical protein KGJ60_13680 [Verrucomicrobiota bacterium]|nr:hypothetical protein [Verrucomicrobiota bacterium]